MDGSDTNVEAVKSFYQRAWNEGDFGVIDEVFAPNYLRHDPRAGEAQADRATQRDVAAAWRAGLPDLHVDVTLTVAEGDLVVAYWTITGTHRGQLMGMPPSGNAITFCGVNIFRFLDGQVVEIWNIRDDLGAQQALAAGSS